MKSVKSKSIYEEKDEFNITMSHDFSDESEDSVEPQLFFINMMKGKATAEQLEIIRKRNQKKKDEKLYGIKPKQYK